MRGRHIWENTRPEYFRETPPVTGQKTPPWLPLFRVFLGSF